MSFPYGQYPGENFSAPSTPLDAFPQWETLEREEQSQSQQQRQEQQSQQGQALQHLTQQHHQQPELHPQTSPPPPPQQHYQTIRLEEPVPTVPSQQRLAHDDFPVRLHHVHRPERRRESPGEHDSAHPHIDTRSSSTSTAVGPVRQSSRSHQQQQQAHPYLRPSTSSSTPLTRQQHVRFASTQASAASSSMPSPSIPSPAMISPTSATGRLAGFGSTVRYAVFPTYEFDCFASGCLLARHSSRRTCRFLHPYQDLISTPRENGSSSGPMPIMTQRVRCLLPCSNYLA